MNEKLHERTRTYSLRCFFGLALSFHGTLVSSVIEIMLSPPNCNPWIAAYTQNQMKKNYMKFGQKLSNDVQEMTNELTILPGPSPLTLSRTSTIPMLTAFWNEKRIA